MAFVAPTEALPEALDIFRILQSISEELSPLLARAIATARLGAPRIAARSYPLLIAPVSTSFPANRESYRENFTFKAHRSHLVARGRGAAGTSCVIP